MLQSGSPTLTGRSRAAALLKGSEENRSGLSIRFWQQDLGTIRSLLSESWMIIALRIMGSQN